MGNRTEIVKKNIKGRTVDKEKYIYNESNQLQQANLFDGKKWTKVVYTYDQDGNLISEVGRDGCEKVQTYYDYTVENRLEAVYDSKKLLMAAAYDGDGNRVFQLNYDPDAYDDWRYGYGCYKNYRNGCGWDDWYEPDDDRDDNRNDGKNNFANHGNSGKKTASVTGSLRCTTNTIPTSVLYANSGAKTIHKTAVKRPIQAVTNTPTAARAGTASSSRPTRTMTKTHILFQHNRYNRERGKYVFFR